MRKQLSIWGVLVVLSFLASPANAKSNSLNLFSPPSIITDDLADKLAADKDFQEFTIATYEMFSNIQKTRSGKQFAQYFETSTKEEEKNNLAIILGFSSKADFDYYLKSTYLLKIAVTQKFPQLLSLSNNLEIVKTASQKVIKTFVKPNPHNSSDCWNFFYAALAACNAGCILGNDYEYCMGVCFGSASIVAFACWETAE